MCPLLRIAALTGVLALGNACSRPTESEPPSATAAAAPSHAPGALGEPARAAFDLLHGADAFEDTRVGFSGDLSRYVAAFRIVLEDPAAATAFHALLAEATPEGRLYAVAGLYFADPPAFDAAVAELATGDGAVRTQHGCLSMKEPIASVLRSEKTSPVIVVAKGATLSSWFAAHPAGGSCDIAGGCVPLSFVGDDRPAPRSPAR